jgi:hypothetical protein
MGTKESAAQGGGMSVKPSSSTGNFSLTSSGEVVVSHQQEATRAPEGKRIHPRRPVPPVPLTRSRPASTAEEDRKRR